MERGSSKHSARVDEQMSQEVQGTVQGIAGARAEEWKMAEPAGEDQPEPTTVTDGDYRSGAPVGVSSAEMEQFSRFGRYIGLSALPGDREALRHSAEVLLAPDDVLEDLDRLPSGVTYRTVAEIWAALGHQM
jgi:hypothetical protein